jgi:hypothetical protein
MFIKERKEKMKKSFFIFCMSLLIAFCSFITAEAATKKVIEKDS